MYNSGWYDNFFDEGDEEEGTKSAPDLSKNETKNDAEKIKHQINFINRKKGLLSNEDLKKINELEKKLLELQSSCWHVWETITLFTQIRQFCKKCDKENKEYRNRD